MKQYRFSALPILNFWPGTTMRSQTLIARFYDFPVRWDFSSLLFDALELTRRLPMPVSKLRFWVPYTFEMLNFTIVRYTWVGRETRKSLRAHSAANGYWFRVEYAADIAYDCLPSLSSIIPDLNGKKRRLVSAAWEPFSMLHCNFDLPYYDALKYQIISTFTPWDPLFYDFTSILEFYNLSTSILIGNFLESPKLNLDRILI